MADCLLHFSVAIVVFSRFALHKNKEKRQNRTVFKTKQLRIGDDVGFAPVSFRVMMFEIFLFVALVLLIILS